MDLSGYIKVTDEKTYQFIYGGQNYSTFYGIYAKFTLDEKEINDEKKKVVKEISFHTLNYKGILSIGRYNPIKLGFISSTVSIDNVYYDAANSVLKINLPVRTRRKRKNTHLNLLDFPEAIEVEKLKEVHINKELISIFNRKKSKERILKILQNMFRRTQHITFYAVGNNCQQSFMKVTK
ncbi:MAG: hypothetical protein GKR88_11730 [Flavobacteriaceae bacterium]|nr:MAG: hypothetical protein GKR88_11730 [Flavobacteriaceae bacterium]